MPHQAVLQPYDEYNRRLESRVHPRDWRNPEPRADYHLVVIGAGAAGLVSAAIAAGLGARVALVERALLGGDCLNVGCVPSKAMIAGARAAVALSLATRLGIGDLGSGQVDFARAMERMRRLRSEISRNDAAARYQEMGIDVFFGHGRFVGPRTLEVAGARLDFRRAVIATGGRPSAPPIEGLSEIPYLTNESVFSLTELPETLLVVGGGPIGCELAQTFARYGSRVTLVESGSRLLPREDQDAATLVADALEADGVRVLLATDVRRIEFRRDEARPGGTSQIELSDGRSGKDDAALRFDRLLIAAGRRPNVEGLDLGAAAVEFNEKGVTVDRRLRTTNRRIYAAGDVCSGYRFTHAADFMARTAVRNALFLGRGRVEDLTIPWCTYTSPELARVGLNEQEAARAGIDIRTFRVAFADLDRTILEGATEGFVKVHTAPKRDRILGATIVGRNAGDLIATLSMAMTHRMGLQKIGATIFPYPTQAEAIRKLGDQFSRTRLTPLARRLIGWWLGG